MTTEKKYSEDELNQYITCLLGCDVEKTQKYIEENPIGAAMFKVLKNILKRNFELERMCSTNRNF